jgi:hypothetical protein
MQHWKTAQSNLTQAHAMFQQVAAALPAERHDQAGVCGHWTPRQVAAHLAGWDREAARALLALLAGAPEELVADIDSFNHASVEARAHLSWDGTCWELRAAHESLQRAIDAVLQAQSPASGYLLWMDGRIRDYNVHTAQLRLWIQDEQAD